MSVEDYCELCDLPESQCIHGNPPPPPKRAVRPPRATRTTARRAPAASSGSSGSPRSAGSRAASGAPARRVQRRWTPPDAFKPDILAVLQDHGGAMEQDELFAALEVRMQERLTTADHETTPEGELRWRYAARRARQALLAEGQMTKGRPGVWVLADRVR